jgi:thioredoxin-like negative regulator of GroEL
MKTTLAGLALALFSAAGFADELIIFHMPVCRPCTQLKKLLEDNPEIVQGFAVSMVDITDDAETTKLFNVSTVPTIVRLDNKTRELGRRIGYSSKKELLEWLDATSSK